jgi:hypothetical protein
VRTLLADRMDKVPPSEVDGTCDPKCLFKCVACEDVFHGDCEGLSKGEKKIVQKVSHFKSKTSDCHALCGRCAQSSKVVWNAATRDASLVTLVLASIAAKKMKKSEVLALAETHGMEDMAGELVEFSVRYHEPPPEGDDDSPEAKLAKLQDAAAEVLLSRVPDASLLGEDLVGIYQRAAKKREDNAPQEEDDTVVPSPIAAASKDVVTALVVASRKRSLFPSEAGEDEPAGGAARGGGKHDPAVNCPGCNLPGKTWHTAGTFTRHLRFPKPCPDMKWPENNEPMDDTVHCNLRAGFNLLKRGRPRKAGRSSDPVPSEPLDPCDYCGDGEKEGEPLLKCITYDEPVTLPLAVDWLADQKPKLCNKTLHLSCVRAHTGASGNATYKGTVPIAEAGRNVIGFCKDCFPRMEAARPAELGADS